MTDSGACRPCQTIVSNPCHPSHKIPVKMKCRPSFPRPGMQPQAFLMLRRIPSFRQFLKFAAVVILALTSVCGWAYEERNVITSALAARDSLCIPLHGSWMPYPACRDREAWRTLVGAESSRLISEGEKLLGTEWHTIPESAYLEYERSGDRRVMERPYEMDRRALNVLALAELAEGRGRFLDDISNGLRHAVNMPSWVLSAHLPAQPSGRSVPEPGVHIIDLASAGFGASLSIIISIFRSELDTAVVSAVEDAVRERILEPYLDESLRRTHWWMAEGWRPGRIINNWNPWCNSNVLLCFLLIEDDEERLIEAVRLTAESTDRYLNYVKGDGACEEGPAYWDHAAGKLYDYLRILCDATGVSCLDNVLLRRMGEYISRSYIGGGMTVNFADAPAVLSLDPAFIYRYGHDCGSREMMNFALSLLRDSSGDFGYPHVPLGDDIWRSLETLRHLEQMCCEIDSLNVIEPALRAGVPRCTWYSETEFAYLRNGSGWFLAAKGGFNNESHNHNDVGSFILSIDGVPVFIDAGVGTYTKKTFSHERYDIWSMRSDWHNLPMINGTSQIFGQEFRAAGVKCDTVRLKFSAEIAGAYSGAARCRSWVRSYDLDEDALRITDRFSLSARVLADTVNFLVCGQVLSETDSLPTCLQGKKKSAGLKAGRNEVIIVSGDVTVSLSFPASMTPSVTEMPLADPRLSEVWGPSLRRISFSTSRTAPLNGRHVFVVRRLP